ncbi:hypothetical protein EDC96DRAFT_472533, partial [Choanephora cucurbitarum]
MFEVRVDHMALTFLHTSKCLNPTLQSRLEIIGDFDFTITHIKGLENTLPDSLSRLYPPIPEDQALEGEDDKQLKRLRPIKLNSDEYKSQTTDYMCPPKHERSDIIREAHKLGHWGIDGVVKHIHTYHGLHWNSIYDDVKNVLLQC